ncbi:protein bric-a-brac 1 [Ctenocephalides felis]|uniref:protein bric-a-brac 1 n=1 Tax=Ctenocephalides felis TaxID=7515 RepID=UPI000E6E1758|nr:protein bric-a-brac 1 [Ctenocephalides felis]
MRRKMIYRDPRFPYRHRQSPQIVMKTEPSSAVVVPDNLSEGCRSPVQSEDHLDQQHYCLRWNNYQSNMTTVFHQLLRNEAFVDVTLACNDLSLKAHKVVLSACSAYFQKLLLENPCSHPTIIMPSDICFSDLQFIIEFVYRGEIDVSQDELQSLLRTADQLKIKGLCEVESNPGPDDIEFSNSAQVSPPSRKVPIKQFRHLGRPNTNTTNTINFGNSNNRLGSGGPPNKRQRRFRPTINTTPTAAGNTTRLDEAYEEEDLEEDKSPPSNLVRKHQSEQPTRNGVVKLEPTGDTDSGDLDAGKGKNSEETPNSDKDKQKSADMSLVMLETRRSAANGHDLSESINPGVYTSQNFLHSTALCDEYAPEPPAPTATPVTEHNTMLDHRGDSGDTLVLDGTEDVKVKLETLRTIEQSPDNDYQSRIADIDMEMSQHSHNSMHSDHSMDHQGDGDHYDPTDHLSVSHSMLVTPELLGLLPNSGPSDMMYGDMMSDGSNEDIKPHKFNSNGSMNQYGGNLSGSATPEHGMHRMNNGPKTWSQEDMDQALNALRNHNMSLTKASATYGIPSTTLWQRAHRLGIDTPKKEGATKSWSEDSLNNALEALRTGTISANKASKAYGIPSSTLYKIARREGIRLAAPFNAAPTAWTPEDLERALEAIRTGQTSVQRASAEFGIPTGTLYGRCKREGIELSRSNPTPWSEDAMGEALEAVRIGQMSINQAAIHYNLPYSSLYGRFKRGKYDVEQIGSLSGGNMNAEGDSPEGLVGNYQMQHQNQHDSPQSYHNHSS